MALSHENSGKALRSIGDDKKGNASESLSKSSRYHKTNNASEQRSKSLDITGDVDSANADQEIPESDPENIETSSDSVEEIPNPKIINEKLNGRVIEIENLAESVTKEDLIQTFKRFDTSATFLNRPSITKPNVRNRYLVEGSTSPGQGYVVFKSAVNAALALEECSNLLLHGRLIKLKRGSLPAEHHKRITLEADDWILPNGVEILAFWSDSIEHKTPRVVARLKANTSGARPKMQYAVDEGVLYWLYPMTSLDGIRFNEARRRLEHVDQELDRIEKLKACTEHAIDLGEMERALVDSEQPARAYRSALQTLMAGNDDRVPEEFLRDVPHRVARFIEPRREYKNSAKRKQKDRSPAPAPPSRKRKREHVIHDVKAFVEAKLSDPRVSLDNLTVGQRKTQIKFLEKRLRETEAAKQGRSLYGAPVAETMAKWVNREQDVRDYVRELEEANEKVLSEFV